MLVNVLGLLKRFIGSLLGWFTKGNVSLKIVSLIAVVAVLVASVWYYKYHKEADKVITVTNDNSAVKDKLNKQVEVNNDLVDSGGVTNDVVADNAAAKSENNKNKNTSNAQRDVKVSNAKTEREISEAQIDNLWSTYCFAIDDKEACNKQGVKQ